MAALKFSHIFAFLIIGASAALGQQGVKGGYYQQTSSSRPTNETGYCYRRIPFQQARSLYNETGNQVERGSNHGRVQWNATNNNGWVTVVDCCEGFQRNSSSGRCESQCAKNCFGGTCVEGICTCDQGWFHSEGVCKPICRRGCLQNAYCFAPDVCECKFGWEKSVQDDCRPVCPGGCVNGDCVAPKVCQCKPGYVLNEGKQSCEAICEGGCPHGECRAPGVCSCYPGYLNPPGEKESCVPDCGPSNCDGGECMSPGFCMCRSGYTRDASNNCIPECRNGCPINGRCVSPDKCVCNASFELDYRNNRCVPVDNQQGQSGQQSGGYQDNHCERPCINGVCMGYNICSCNDGYAPDPRDPSRTYCRPSCRGGCPNGVCTSPNLCLCKPGYVKDRSGVKGSQRCIPQENY